MPATSNISKILRNNQGDVVFYIILLCLYIPRYTQERALREIIAHQKQVSIVTTVHAMSDFDGTYSIIDAYPYRISVPLGTTLKLGDKVVAIGKLNERLPNYLGEQYLLSVQPSSFKVTNGVSGFSPIVSPLNMLAGLRSHSFGVLRGVLGEPHLSFLFSILFGSTGAHFDPELRTQFSLTGLTHVLSASGMNVVIVFSFSQHLFTRAFGKRRGIMISILGMGIYCFLTGMGPSIMRALFMALGASGAMLVGRRYNGIRWLCMTCLILLIYQPFLIYSFSFLLTLTATIGVLTSRLLLPEGEELGEESPLLPRVMSYIAQDWKTTFSAWLWTMPILMILQSKVSLVALIANPLLLWMVPLLMTFAFILFCAALLFPAWILGFLVVIPWLVSEVFLEVVKVLSASPFWGIETTPISIMGLFGYYLCLVVYLLRRVADGYGKR